MTHTQGFWKANGITPRLGDKPEDYLACAVWANDKPICTTKFSVGKYEELPIEEQAANAQLIAAAPEMLEVLQYLLTDAQNFDLHLGKRRADMIRAALAKAGVL